jgi:hypothetical protein
MSSGPKTDKLTGSSLKIAARNVPLRLSHHRTLDQRVSEPEPIDDPDPVRRSSGAPKNWIQTAVTSLMILQLVASTPVPARRGLAPAFQLMPLGTFRCRQARSEGTRQPLDQWAEHTHGKENPGAILLVR